MPLYTYKAVDAKGKAISGSIESDSEKSARLSLKAKKIFPMSLSKSSLDAKPPGKTTAAKSAKAQGNETLSEKFQAIWQILNSQKLKLQFIMLFTRQLATLIDSGMPLEQALKLIASQSEQKQIKDLAQQLRTSIAEGYSLAQSIRKSSYTLPREYIAVVEAGEETGHLNKVMGQLADEIEFQAKSRQGLVGALTYPIVMVIISIGVIISMMVYVVPQISKVFTSQKQTLPAITEVVIGISNFLIEHGSLIALPCILVVLVYLFFFFTHYNFRFRMHKAFTNMPFFGRLMMMNQLSMWSRSFSSLLGSGLPTLQALVISSEVINNLYYKSLFKEVAEKVREGSSITKVLKDQSSIPSFVVHMVSSGEGSGQLASMMGKVSEYYNFGFKSAIETRLKLIEPFLIVFMGGVVMVIVLAVLLPVFELNNLVQ